MELRGYLAIVWRRLWLIALATVVAGVAAYTFSVTSTPVYEATATLQINYGADPRSDAYSSLLLSQRAAATYVEELRSPQLARDVAQALGLSLSPERLLGISRVLPVRDTGLVRVTIESSSPDFAQTLANKFVEVFIARVAARQQSRYQSAKRDLDAQIATLEKQIADTQKALAPLGDPTDPTSANIPEFARVERSALQTTLSSYQTRYAILLTSAEDLRLAAARYSDNITIFAPAETPRTPVRPKTTTNLALGLLVGLLLGLGAAYLLEYLDDTVKSAEEVQQAVALATLGVVGRIPTGKGSDQEPRLLAEPAARSSLGETYRILRVNIDFSWAGAPGRVLMITSANPREGKTTTLSNVAAVLAKDNRRVVMVDADLRRPSLHRAFGLDATPGLTNLLADPAARARDYVRPTALPNLSLLPSGAIPPNPSELLGSPRFAVVLEELKALADVVLIDTPPALAVADSALVAAKADGVVLVVEAGAVRAGALVRASEILARAEARVLGVVLNKLSPRSADYHYYYYQHYYGVKPGSSNGSEKQHQEMKA